MSNEAAELREYFDAPSSPGPSDEGSGSNTAATVSERCSDEYFLAMHAPLERAERKRQGAAALHRDNGSKRRGQPAIHEALGLVHLETHAQSLHAVLSRHPRLPPSPYRP